MGYTLNGRILSVEDGGDKIARLKIDANGEIIEIRSSFQRILDMCKGVTGKTKKGGDLISMANSDLKWKTIVIAVQ